MTDQMGTPGSTADTSVNGGKGGAPKDKACPFCNQAFTSSSLGRHLDLYIKEKNPKPADGLHDVVEIRKLRGGITRRQPRNSTSKREDSTPAGTPGAPERRSPERGVELDTGMRDPDLSRGSGAMDIFNGNGKSQYSIHQASWEATGVINNIPMSKNGGSVNSWEGEERDATRRPPEGRNRSVSKQILAKTTFEQKQKMMEALDNAKAAELALRELLGSLRAAKQRIDGPSIFSYDPLSLDFPALTLHCLPPPPTLFASSTPIPSPTSWSILPPDETQYEALRSHFHSEFHRWRLSCAIASTTPRDDLSYPPPSDFASWDDPVELAQRVEADTAELETKLAEHLQRAHSYWKSLPPPKRSEIWTLELARSVGRKADTISTLKKEREMAQQETEHLKLQVDELSRLQHPREFRLAPPTTIPVQGRVIAEAGEMGLRNTSVGWSLLDRHMHLDEAIERAIGRWKGVVKEARGAGPHPGGLTDQRSLSGESASSSLQVQLPPPNPISQSQQRPQHLSPAETLPLSKSSSRSNMNANLNPVLTNGAEELGSDADADADADMEDDESFVEMTSGRPEAGFRLGNGDGNPRTGSGREGLENQTCVGGYLRIGA